MRSLLVLSPLLCWSLGCTVNGTSDRNRALESTIHGEWSNRERYVAFVTPTPLVIDGRLDEVSWAAAPKTAAFGDIQGAAWPEPRFSTTARMLWDAEYLYIGAVLEDPHLWSTLTERDSVIYKDNDFEVFIDPDGDTHQYYELEINLLGTEWDLLLEKPYRDGGPALNEFDTAGLLTAVSLYGTLNDPRDRDQGWSVEIAIPWSALKDIAGCSSPPSDGDVWWLNFSRVQWKLDVVRSVYSEEARYVKRTDEAGTELAEDNWVWSPQGVIAMHEPESWGLVMFAKEVVGRDSLERTFVDPADLLQREFLRRIYKAERHFREQAGHYSGRVEELDLQRGVSEGHRFELTATRKRYEAVLIWSQDGQEQRLHINETGRLW